MTPFNQLDKHQDVSQLCCSDLVNLTMDVMVLNILDISMDRNIQTNN